MTFNYKVGLFRIWLVLSLFWALATSFLAFPMGMVTGVPLGFGMVLFLIVWAIRGFGVRKSPPLGFIGIEEFRRHMITEIPNRALYTKEVEPAIDSLKAKYGTHVPVTEIVNLQEVIHKKVAQVEKQRQKIIDREAKKGAVIEIASLRRNFEEGAAAYQGPDRDTHVKKIDDYVKLLVEQYGDHIPVDEAYKLMRELDPP